MVGAGPTGLTAAATLARHGIRVRCIDRAVTPPADRSRALAVQARTLEIFDDLGVVQQAIDAGLWMNTINVWTPSGRRGSIRPAGMTSLDTPYRGIFSLPQDETERVLGDLVARSGVVVERGVALTACAEAGDALDVTLRHADGRVEQDTVPWVIGCDGAHSIVRELAAIPFPGDAYPNECLLGDVHMDWALPGGELSICPSANGVLLAFPLSGDRHFRVIMILPTNAHAGERTLPPDEFSAQLARLAPRAGGTPRVIDAAWLTRYRLYRRGVPAYRAGRVFVAGDAAHIHSPIGGQGMNTGIQDAYNLAWKLALVVRGQAPSWVLETYDAERRPVGEKLLRFTDRAFGGITGRSTTSRLLRRIFPTLGTRLLGFPVIGRRLTYFVSQLGIKYRHSALSVEAPGAARLDACAPHAGDRAPDAPLGAGRLFDVFRGPHHTLLVFGEDDATARTVRERWPALVHVVLVNDDVARRTYGALDRALYLVRPDGYVGFRGGLGDGPALIADLERRLPRS